MDLLKVARMLGFKMKKFHPMVQGSVTQCPACFTKPIKLARKGRFCRPVIDLSVEVLEHGSLHFWVCHRCCYGHDVVEFVSFALYADRFCNLREPLVSCLEGWFSAIPDRMLRSGPRAP